MMDNKAIICLCLWLFVGQVRGSHIPQRMNRTIQNLLQHYKIPRKDRFNGKPVFSKEPLSEKVEAKKLFMGGILETYDKLIGQMLMQLPTPIPHVAVSLQPGALDTTPNTDNTGSDDTVRKDLDYILKMIDNLKSNHYQKQKKFLKGLQDLQDIKTDNVVVQSKALWELPWLYEEASSLVNHGKAQRRRRRRQIQKAKNRARAQNQ